MKYRTSLFIILVLLYFQRLALAHAFLDHAEPKVGQTAAVSLTEIKIWFTEDIEPEFSEIVVTDSTGKQVDKKDTHVDTTNKSLLIVSVSGLTAGTYKVSWHVVASDTHKTKGTYSFEVKA